MIGIERRQQVEQQEGDERKPDPSGESTVEDPRGHESWQGVGIFESIGVGAVAASARSTATWQSRPRPRVRARRRRRHLENEVIGERDAERFEMVAGELVIGEFMIGSSR